jgi:helix-turn-helix protein
LHAKATLPESQDRLTLFILKAIRKANESKLLIGRKKLSDLSVEAHLNLSEQQMRKVLDQMASQGLVQMGRGRIGLGLTPLGRVYLESAQNG